MAVLLLAASSAVSAWPAQSPSQLERQAYLPVPTDEGLRYKIFGGAPVQDSVPYMAQVFNVIGVNESLQCGGTLISPTQVHSVQHSVAA